MATEDMIWAILDKQFCSYKTEFEQGTFCKNEYSLTGICSKFYCPLANGQYATVREEDGILYLFMKTIERSHTPANLWEKIPLPNDMAGAIKVIDENLQYWPRNIINKVKERLVRLHQYLIRFRKWYYRAKPRLVTVHKKFERREQRRELKSLIAAKLDFVIKNELQERLKQGTYEPFINLRNNAYRELLREERRKEELALPPRARARLMRERSEARAAARAEARGESKKTGKATVEYVDGDEEVDDMEDYTLKEEEDEEDMEGEEEGEQEDEEELEEEGEEEIKNDLEEELEGATDELKEDIMKHLPINLRVEPGDDREMVALKRQLLLRRKRKMALKHKSHKKKKRAHQELEFETTTATSTHTTSTSW